MLIFHFSLTVVLNVVYCPLKRIRLLRSLFQHLLHVRQRPPNSLVTVRRLCPLARTAMIPSRSIQALLPRPMVRPAARVAAIPSLWRSSIISRSILAIPARMVSIRFHITFFSPPTVIPSLWKRMPLPVRS